MIERRSVPENKHYVAVKAADLDLLEAEIERLRAELADTQETLVGALQNNKDYRAERDRLRELLLEIVGHDSGPDDDWIEWFNNWLQRADAALAGEGSK